MAVRLDGSSLTIEDVVKVARHGEPVELAPEALERIRACRGMLEEKIQAREIMYGVNTGIGEFSEVVLSDEQVQQFQRYLIYNHAAGIGEPCPIEHVRAAMTSRVNVHARGYSGCRPEITLTYVEMLNRGRDPRGLREGERRGLRRSRPDEPDRPEPDGRGRELLPGRAHAHEGRPGPRRDPGAGPAGPRRPGRHQRLEPHHRHRLPAALRRRALDRPGRDRGRDDARGAARQHEALRGEAPRAARLPGGGEVRRQPAPRDGGLGPGDRQAQGQGPGRLFDALHAAGDRRAARPHGLRAQAVRDRAERRGRQSHLRARRRPRADRRQLPGHADQPAHRHGGRGPDHGLACSRSAGSTGC